MSRQKPFPAVTDEEWQHFVSFSLPGETPVIPEPMLPLVEAMLPVYQRARTRWPLWTYERRPPRELSPRISYQDRYTHTWYAPEAWPHRTGWFPSHTLSNYNWSKKLTKEFPFITSVRWVPSGHLAVVFVKTLPPIRSQGKVSRLFERYVVPVPSMTDPETKDLLIGCPEERQAWFVVRLPYLTQARTLAGVAQTDRSVPTSTSEIRLPDFLSNHGFDRHDRKELADSLTRVLFNIDFSDSPDEPVAYENYLLAMWNWTLRPPKSSRGESSQRSVDRESLAVAFFKELGALPDKKGGKRFLLRPDRLLTLYEEAVEIVETVRSWEPIDSLVEQVIEISRLDPTWNPSNPKVYEYEKARRRLRSSSLLRKAFYIRFPFLRPDEVDAMIDGERSDKATARWILLNRLPGLDADEHDRSLQTKLSEARRRES